MKILTTKTVKKFSPEWGWIDQVQFRLFGFHFWTENHKSEPIQDDVKTLEFRAMQSLKSDNYRQVSFSEMSANLPDLNQSQFENFQNEVAQFQTRF